MRPSTSPTEEPEEDLVVGRRLEDVAQGAQLIPSNHHVLTVAFTKDDFIDEVQDIITVGEFYEKAAGGQIIFT